MGKITLYAALLFSTAIFSQIQTFKKTSFEEATAGDQYVDTGDANVAHDLINNAGQSMVDFDATAAEIGFDATYTPYDTPNVGLTDGDFVGASNFTGDVTAYTDGAQGYGLSDIDGNFTLTFDIVDFTDFTNNTVNIDYYLNVTGYEGDGTVNESGSDRVRIYVRDLTNDTEIDIVNTTGSDINDLDIEGRWITGIANIPNDAMAQLVVEVRTNSGSENIYLDNVKFSGSPATANISLSVTEIFPGQAGADLTEDWFEIKNTGSVAYLAANDGALYYDDESASATDADLITGITSLQPGESAIVLVTANTDAVTNFRDVWGNVIDLMNIRIATTDGAGLGGGGDAVNLWIGDPATTSVVATGSYPDTAANDGQSYDVELSAFSIVENANGAVQTAALGGSNGDVPNIGSPGNGPKIVQSIVQFEKAFVSVSEDGKSVDLSITISEAPSADVTVDVALLNVGTASEGNDFTFSSTQKVTFPSGSVAPQNINIPILNNTVDGSDVFFVLELGNISSGVLGTNKMESIYILDDDTQVPIENIAELDVKFLSSYLVDASGTAEITAYDPFTQRLFVTNTSSIEVLDFNNPANITSIKTIDISPFGASVQSVAVKNGIVAAAIGNAIETENGSVLFMDTDGNNTKTVTVGVLPDMITFTPDGKKVLTANEGQPSNDYTIDPEGTVSVIDISAGLANITQSNVITINFNAFDGMKDAFNVEGIRIYGPNATVSQDLEPEYITISPDSNIAYVSLQENNAYATIDLTNNTVTDIKSFGLKDHSLPKNSLDATDDTDFIFNASWPIKGMYMPDAIANYTVNGIEYIVTANEGDSRDYNGFSEEKKITDADYKLDLSVFSNENILNLKSNLGRIGVTSASGDANNDGFYEEIHVFGGRSFSIFEAQSGNLVYDSANDFEVITAADPVFGTIFNTSNSNNNFKNRSDNKGPEPEGLLVRELNGKFYAFVLLERVGGMMVYDVTNPVVPIFLQYVNNRNAVEGATEGGDLGPEGVAFVEASESPTGKALVILSNEVSATVSIYSLDNVILSVDDNALVTNDSFSLYPNPAKGKVFVNIPGNYKVFDMFGREVLSKTNAASLEISSLSSGTYIVENEKGLTKKLLVE